MDAAIQKVEFKTTVLPLEEPKIQALLGDQPVRRKVYFYDTPELDLFERHLIVRARVTQGDDDDSTVKLRPADDLTAGAAWRTVEGVRVELDVVGTREVPTAKLDSEPDPGEIEQVEAGKQPVASLFSKGQEALVARYSDVPLASLAVLGPVDARKWELDGLEGFPHTLTVEEWSLPDATHFIELSFKVKPAETDTARADFNALLTHLGLDTTGVQEPKTERVLRFFAAKFG
jgi:hypothetical protein